ncbi:MAG: protein kinase [Acidimicrobiales bacterium]|nr:protein kinase [Acidimicrobiales bacterium]
MHETRVPPSFARRAVHSGQLLGGRYLLAKLIASGGMAEVWQAHDTVLARPVAVKILHPHLAADATFLGRFRAEAVAAARLHHPSIVAIFDTCSDNGIEAIVMELVRGRNLRQYLDEAGPLDANRVVDIGADVADALAAAHRAGLVHRDIKPANILLTEDGRVMVTDFGIAKVRDDPDRTETGTMLGSVKYLSPEQVEGAPVDGRTDIYALGIVLYEALTGRAPFVADSQAATALARLHSLPPRPRQLRPSLSPALDEVVMRAIARNPNDRFPNAGEFRAALLATRVAQIQPVVVDKDRTPVYELLPVHPRSGEVLPQRRHRGSVVGWLVFLLSISALAVAGVLLYKSGTLQDLFGQIKDNYPEAPIPGAPTTGALTIVRAVPFDPLGDGEESNNTASLAADGNATTTWRTEGYDTRNLGGLKPGVGIWVELAQPSKIHRLKAISRTQGWAAEVYIAEQPGRSLGDWGEPVAKAKDIAGNADFDVDAVRGRYVLLWITDLGEGHARVFAEIAEIQVIGSA